MNFILDNASTLRSPEVMRWLQRNRGLLLLRACVVFVGQSLERLFSGLTQRLKRLVARSVADLESAITTYLDRRNEIPRPFKWTASFADIIAKVQKANGTFRYTTLASLPDNDPKKRS